MASSILRASVRLSRDIIESPWPHRASDQVREWQGHVDAGRIGNAAPSAPHVVDRRTAMIRAFAGLAKEARR